MQTCLADLLSKSGILKWKILFLVAATANGQPLVKELNTPFFEVVAVKINGTNQLAAGATLEQGCRPPPTDSFVI